MDTPEADISAIQSGRMQPLPVYTEEDTSSQPLISTVDPRDTRHIPPTYSKEQPSPPSESDNASLHSSDSILDPPQPFDQFRPYIAPPNTNYTLYPVPNEFIEEDAIVRERAQKGVITNFFNAIRDGQDDVVDLFLMRNLVTANTLDEDGKTPLLAAVATRNVKMVQRLLDAGAEPDAFGIIAKERTPYSSRNAKDYWTLTIRTPLQLSASIGHLPLVKLFMERYHCNDALVAPDGQIALRLASSNGHREVVDYLPSRRGGGFLRWKTAHKRSISRVKYLLSHIYKFVKFFVWDIEKFLLWSCPKHIIVIPVAEGCKYCWKNKKRFWDGCVSEVKKTPDRVSRASKWVWRGVKKIPSGLKACGKVAGEAAKAFVEELKKMPKFVLRLGKGMLKLAKDIVKALWEFVTIELPKIVKELSIWIWKVLTVKIPTAITITAKWLWSGLLSTLKAILDIFLKITSLLHTALMAIVTFFRNLSLTDILHGIQAVLEAIFITLPQTLWRWVKEFGDASYKVMKALFGVLGECVWWIITALGWVVVYLPRKVWGILVSLGESAGRGLHEILVWFSPKV